MKENAEGTTRVVEIGIDVKSWKESPPDVRDVRPKRCPGCDTAGVRPDGRVVLHGHGVRVRQRWGPDRHDGAPEISELPQRRYRCRECSTVVVVRPRGAFPRKRYTAAAIALALWLWAGDALTDAQVRERVGVHPKPGLSRPERWTTLRRWAAAARDGQLWARVRGHVSWTLRQCAERAARIVAVVADPDAARVFAGAALAG